MPVRSRLLAPACLALALGLAACGGASTSSPAGSAPASAAPSAASEQPSTDASPAAPAGASGSPAASAGAGITVTAVDYSFEGVPDQVPSGTVMSFTNTGKEVHEMVVVRKLPTTTQTFDELLAMPQDDALKLIQDIGVAFAAPGETAPTTVTTGEPGDYIMLCFIPQGTTSIPSMDPGSSEAPSVGTGAPHFTLGMKKEFTVTP